MTDNKRTISIPYKGEKISIKVPEQNLLGILYPNKVEISNEEETIREAIANPVSSKSFKEFLSGAQNILFIVNDQTRPTPTKKVFDVIYDQIKDKPIKIIIATGVHRGPTEEEFLTIFGKYYEEFKDKIYVHDSKRDEDMVYIGTSKNGTEMWVNKLGVEADRLIPITSVEPHYFAGYTGGRKSFLPGIASYKTITQNHKHALKPEAKALNLEGNPVHEDMIDAIKTIKEENIFSIQIVLDGEHRVYKATAGHIHQAFEKSVKFAEEVFCVEIQEKADIVVTIASPPTDVDLYQSQKALDNGKLALKEEGILLMVSPCRTGVGPETFLNLMASYKSPEEVLEKIEREFKLGYHKAAKMAEIGTWADMWGVTDLPDETMESVFIRPFHNIQSAIDEALKVKGPNAKILFLMDGGMIVPMIKQH